MKFSSTHQEFRLTAHDYLRPQETPHVEITNNQ